MSGSALLASLLLAYTGMLGFCLGKEKHWKQLVSPRYRLGFAFSAHRQARWYSAWHFTPPTTFGLVAWPGLAGSAPHH